MLDETKGAAHIGRTQRYDGESRLAAIRQLADGVQISFRRFLWSGDKIRQEREETGSTVIKRFFPQGFRIEVGPDAGSYYYTRDHLGSVRELTDAAGSLRSRYAYDPYGRRVKQAGDLEADFGFAGMFWTREAQLNLTWYRAYDPELGRWLSRDPLSNAEESEGPNLYAYVGNTAGTGYGQLQKSGTVTLNGSLSVDLLPGFTPASDDIFMVVSASSRSGAFSSFSYPSNRVAMTLTNSPTAVILRVTDVFSELPPVLLTPGLVGTNAILVWSATSNVTYRLEYSPSLSSTDWIAVDGHVTASSNTASKLDPLTTSNRFYRVRVLP